MQKTIIKMFALSAWISFDGGETWREHEIVRFAGPQLVEELTLVD